MYNRKTNVRGSYPRYRKKTRYARPSNSYRKTQPSYYARKARTVYKYPGVGRSIGGAIGGVLGNTVFPGAGGVVGNALGQVVGGGAQALVKKVTGFGDYNVVKNALVHNIDAVPEFSVNNERCTMITHREFIRDIRGSEEFNLLSFRINPAIGTTFPWLNSIAENYEQYVVQGMIYEFKTTSAMAIGSVNTSLGTVVMATQYNSLSPIFTNKQQMENYEFSQSTVPSASMLHPIECDPMQTQCGGVFNMFNPLDQSGDTRLYDIGRFNIATVGMQDDNSVVGELWVSYKICLLKPRLQSVTDAADAYTVQTPSQISPAFPLGLPEFPLIPYSGNDKFTSITGPNGNNIIVDPSFTGVLQFIVSYKFTSLEAVIGQVRCPVFSVAFGNAVDVTEFYMDLDSITMFQNLTVTEFLVDQNNLTNVAYFKFQGGLQAGDPPRISLSNMFTTGTIVFSRGYLSIMSVPSSFIPPD